ncbi:MAG TPA: hypothetical protein VG406_21330 [Isosphaeraceae bacterium]|jgi:hypothetical protein|nr:hypothetical protein [Isosphaeraceae bacterium]
MTAATLEQVRNLARGLGPRDKLKLIDDLARQLIEEVPPAPAKHPFPSMRGALAHLGPGPSAEEIDEARREAWKNFPREDI